MYYDFECIINDSNKSNKNNKHLPTACGLCIKSDYPNILEDKYEYYCGEDPQSGGSTDVVDWFIGRMSYYNKLFKDIFSINILLREETITPLTTECFYRRENLDTDIVRDHDHLNGKFSGCAQNKCNLQAKKTFVPIYAFNSTNYDNHFFITKLAKKIRLKI